MSSIGIIITTFMRDELLFKSVQSLLDNWQDNFELIIVDQGEIEIDKKKAEWISNIQSLMPDSIHYYKAGFDSGLSYCRNLGVNVAKKLECQYVLIGSDSFLFNSTIKWLNCVGITIRDNTHINGFDRIGFELTNCCCDWEAELRLIENESFELDFIDKDGSNFYSIFYPLHYKIYRCDIVRNFFLTTTDSLIEVPWDKELKLGEHEDHSWQYKTNGYKTGWTNLIYADKMTDRPDKYADFRRKNFNEGLAYLRKKYSISGWVQYKNLERAKKS